MYIASDWYTVLTLTHPASSAFLPPHSILAQTRDNMNQLNPLLTRRRMSLLYRFKAKPNTLNLVQQAQL